MGKFLECFIKEKGNDNVLNPSYMSDDLDVNYVKKVWGLNNSDVEWYVLYLVEMEERIGCGFNEHPQEIERNGNVPEDFQYSKHSFFGTANKVINGEK